MNSSDSRNTNTPPRGNDKLTRVYIARYILFLIIYLILTAASVFVFKAFLNISGGGDYKSVAAVTRTASASGADAAMAVVDEEEYVLSVINNVTFSRDLSEYEQFMNPADRDAYITLVNQTHMLNASYKPADLMGAPYVRTGVESPYLRLIAAKSLEAMLNEAYAAGCTKTLTVTSCYRSYEYQKQLFDSRVSVYAYLGEEKAREKVAATTAIPGQSEHQFGLTADIHSLVSADTSFENTFEAKWLAENAWKFGFILRYPEDKTDITGVMYEPWHFRYVGGEAAAYIMENGLCLEEFLALYE